MREYLFRGKLGYNGEWAESSYPFGTMVGGVEIYDFNTETVGQWTGICDKNGVRIFEGDICDWLHGDYLYTVCWDEQGAKFEVSGDDEAIGFDDLYQDELEVVGNIYDNPELLNKEDDDNE